MINERRIFNARMDNVPEMMEFIETLTNDFTAELSYNITLICEEILVNIAGYAYPEKDGQLSVLWENDTDNRKLKIEFEDSGIPFDPLSKDEPDISVPVSERKIGGLGIMMVRKLADEIKYTNKGGKNILTVVKYY